MEGSMSDNLPQVCCNGAIFFKISGINGQRERGTLIADWVPPGWSKPLVA
jgi:hypothetical protein